MPITHIGVDAKHTRHFLDACQGNWHNCIHVTCCRCPAPDQCPAHGFLFCPDPNCIPLIMPLSDARLLFSRYPEPEECLCAVSMQQFTSLYQAYLAALCIPDGICPARFLLDRQEEALYQW